MLESFCASLVFLFLGGKETAPPPEQRHRPQPVRAGVPGWCALTRVGNSCVREWGWGAGWKFVLHHPVCIVVLRRKALSPGLLSIVAFLQIFVWQDPDLPTCAVHIRGGMVVD